MTFIDLKNHVVFNGSDLGKQYAANAIIERCGIKPEQQKHAFKNISQKMNLFNNNDDTKKFDQQQTKAISTIVNDMMQFRFMEDLMRPDPNINSIPKELLEEQRKKKKPRLRHRF